ncbi:MULTISPECIES: mandelate racemase/muconate lactonizing enzyme family protein [unclassified Haladaptatus]|uniref:mandelate racemase/muconate lactonizing enzyme family protein n=1 Tax=unclassified Haladaptatus TaxID=2622732 RepID=UPI0023E8A29F|nr:MULTISPECIES: mandelate racemase/muconate lactonizing enzyme family protein [unclassified Haladaptatus]
MQLDTISAYNLSSPIDPPQDRHYAGGVRRLLKRDVVLVVVETADGERGVATGGATSSAMREYFEGASHSDFAGVLEDMVAPALTEGPLSGPADVRARIEDLDLPEMLESQAISAVDIAYHDILGKRQGAPIYDLLADGDVRTELPLYASAGMYMPPEGYAKQARAIADRGFRGYKYRPGLGYDEDLRTIELIREAVGDDVEIMVDAHTWWKLGDASYSFDELVSLVREMEAFDPYWLEEPVPPADYDAYRRLAAQVDVPLAGGESEESPEGLLALADTDAVGFLQGDVRHHRGFTGCWEVVEACRDRDVTFLPHNFGTHLGLVANAHLAAAIPMAEPLEYPVFGDDVAGMYPFPLAEDIIQEDLGIEGGHFSLPDGPGLGVTVNLDVVEEYPHIDGPWTEFLDA